MKQPSQQIYASIAYSYSEYIKAYLDLISNSMFFSTPYLDEETSHIQEELKRYFLDLPELISPHNPDKESCAKRLLTIREKLEEKYRTLIGYQRELSLLLTIKQNDSTFIEHYFETTGLKDIDPNTIYFDQLASDCVAYVFGDTSGVEKQKRASSLLPYIPIRITRDNYIQYIRSSISHIAITNRVDSAKYLVSILNQLFDGRTYFGYGHHFVDLEASLVHLHTINNAEEFFEEVDLLNETIENCLTMLNQMFRMICTFSNLLIYEALDFTELTEMHASFFDLYYALKNILLKSEDYELLLTSLPERVEEIEKELLEDYQKACLTPEPDPLLPLIQTYLNMNIQQIFGFTTAKHNAYSEEVLKVLDDFIVELKDKLDSLPTLERKYRMQYFIGQIPFVMSNENFKAYVQHAFKNTSQIKPYLLAANQLSAILEEAHYYPEPKDIPVVESPYEEDDEAAKFIAAHADLFKEDQDTDPFFDENGWLPE